MQPGEPRYISYADFAAWCKLTSYVWCADPKTGYIYNALTGKRVISQRDHAGYECISTRFLGVRTYISVARTIWIAVHRTPIPDHKLTIDHINGIKTNNRIENLRLMTREENVMIGNRKCSPELVRIIREEVRNGSSRRSAAKKYQIAPETVNRIVDKLGCYEGD